MDVQSDSAISPCFCDAVIAIDSFVYVLSVSVFTSSVIEFSLSKFVLQYALYRKKFRISQLSVPEKRIHGHNEIRDYFNYIRITIYRCAL